MNETNNSPTAVCTQAELVQFGGVMAAVGALILVEQILGAAEVSDDNEQNESLKAADRLLRNAHENVQQALNLVAAQVPDFNSRFNPASPPAADGFDI